MGYIGLPTAAFISSKGYEVHGYDVNETLIENLKNAQFSFPEKGLNSLLAKEINSGSLTFSSNLVKSNIYIICVPTPVNFNDVGKPSTDLTYVNDAVSTIINIGLDKSDLVILESTSPVGTTKTIFDNLQEANLNCGIAYCPERVIPGNLLSELQSNDRIIGGIDSSSTLAASKFYESIIDGKVHLTDSNTAELCKLTENSFRDTNLAFANELSIICSSLNIDPYELISLANKHPRVNVLQPGPGVGGHCIAVDPWFIVESFPEAKLIKMSREVNQAKTDFVIEDIEVKINLFLSENTDPPKVAILGLSYKPDIDDIRESPALKIAQSLMQKFPDISLFDPFVKEQERLSITKDLPDVNAYDLIVILVKHQEFQNINFFKNSEKVKILDYCGLLNDL